MKITSNQLKQIIKEELTEMYAPDDSGKWDALVENALTMVGDVVYFIRQVMAESFSTGSWWGRPGTAKSWIKQPEKSPEQQEKTQAQTR